MASRPAGKGPVASKGMFPVGLTHDKGDCVGSPIIEASGFFGLMSPICTMPA
jgi:hypothetical protein